MLKVYECKLAPGPFVFTKFFFVIPHDGYEHVVFVLDFHDEEVNIRIKPDIYDAGNFDSLCQQVPNMWSRVV